MATNLSLRIITFLSFLRSKIVRLNFFDIENFVNNQQTQIDGLTTPPAGNEVTNARDYHNVLRNRIQSNAKAWTNKLIIGGDIIPQDTPNMTFKVKAIEGIVNGVGVIKGYGTWARSGTTITMTELAHGLSNGNKVYVDVTSDATPLPLGEYTIGNVATDTFDITGVASGNTAGTAEYSRYSATITAPTTNPRYDVVVIESDNDIIVIPGSESTDPILPTITDTQKPIAILKLTGGMSQIQTANIVDARNQGAWYIKEAAAKYKWKIQNAIDDLGEGSIFIGNGEYYEEVDLSGIDNLILEFESRDAKIYRVDNTKYCIKSINSGGSETTGMQIKGGQLLGNSKTGAIELMKLDYVDKFLLKDMEFDGNASSTATYKNMFIDHADQFRVRDILPLDVSGDIDNLSYFMDNSTDFNFIILGRTIVDSQDLFDTLLQNSEVNL